MKTTSESMFNFVQVIHELNIFSCHDRIQKYTTTTRLDTSLLALALGFSLNPWCNQFFLYGEPVQFCPHLQSIPTHSIVHLIPEFDLSIPATRDDLGGLVRVPQGADAHLVVRLDPVVKLGGLPIPDVQFSICISRNHITVERKILGGKR